jgi:glycosyltransferase involved in cell wall biosynthesis
VASGDRWAGAESQVASLLRSLREHPDLELCAVVLNEGRLAEEIRKCEIDVRVICESHHGIWKIAMELASFANSKHVDILHAHRYKENLLASIAAHRCGIRHVLRSQHGMSEPFTGIRRQKQRLVRLVDAAVQRYMTERVIAVSQDLAVQLADRLGSSKTVMIRNGIDVGATRSELSTGEAKARLGIEASALVVGTAARLEPVKRIDLLLRAATQICGDLPNTKVLIAGEGAEEARLRAMARALGLGSRALFLGHRTDIFDVLRAMDVFVLCSDHEGLPMVVLESLALGTAVVARRVGGIAEVLSDGFNGILVNTSDSAELAAACVRLLRDPEQRRRIAANGKDVVEGAFTVRQCAAEVARLYRCLTAA